MVDKNGELTIKHIKYNSIEYFEELKLRNKILRNPLGMSIYTENLEADIADYHLGAYIGNTLVGTLVLLEVNQSTVKMRQVAIDFDMQSQRIGSAMIRYSEEYAVDKGYTTMVLNARKTAVGFYTKLGYVTISDEFLEINIPHYKMHKILL